MVSSRERVSAEPVALVTRRFVMVPEALLKLFKVELAATKIPTVAVGGR